MKKHLFLLLAVVLMTLLMFTTTASATQRASPDPPLTIALSNTQPSIVKITVDQAIATAMRPIV